MTQKQTPQSGHPLTFPPSPLLYSGTPDSPVGFGPCRSVFLTTHTEGGTWNPSLGFGDRSAHPREKALWSPTCAIDKGLRGVQRNPLTHLEIQGTTLGQREPGMPFPAVTPAQATEADSPHPGARRETEAHSCASAAPRTPTRVVEKQDAVLWKPPCCPVAPPTSDDATAAREMTGYQARKRLLFCFVCIALDPRMGRSSPHVRTPVLLKSTSQTRPQIPATRLQAGRREVSPNPALQGPSVSAQRLLTNNCFPSSALTDLTSLRRGKKCV